MTIYEWFMICGFVSFFCLVIVYACIRMAGVDK